MATHGGRPRRWSGRLVAQTPWLAAAFGVAGTVIIWTEALEVRFGLRWVAPKVGPGAYAMELAGRAWYWSQGPALGLLALLLPMAAWARRRGAKPWPLTVHLVLHAACGLAATSLLGGSVLDWLKLVGAATLLSHTAGGWKAGRTPPHDLGVLVSIVSYGLLLGTPILAGVFLPEPGWLSAGAPTFQVGPSPIPTVLAAGLAWFGMDRGVRRLYHCGRAGRLDPAWTWSLPVAALGLSAWVTWIEALPRWTLLATAGQGLVASGVVILGARRLRKPALDPMRRMWGGSVWAVGLGGTVAGRMCAQDSVEKVGSVLAAGLIVGLAAILLESARSELSLLDAAANKGALRHDPLIGVPVTLATSSGRPPSGRALLATEQLATSVLSLRERHPVAPVTLRPWLLIPPREAEACWPLVARLLGRDELGSEPLAKVAQPLSWLARPEDLLLDLDADPSEVVAELERRRRTDSSPTRRLTWCWLLIRAHGHLGQVDRMARLAAETLSALQESAWRPEMGAGGLLDVLRAGDGFFPSDPDRIPLASATAVGELASALSREWERIWAQSLAARDPAAITEVARHRTALAHEIALLHGTVNDEVRKVSAALDDAEQLLARAWERRGRLKPEPITSLLDAIIGTWWAGGYAPLLARAPGEPRIGALLAQRWRDGILSCLERSHPLLDPDPWYQSISRRMKVAASAAPRSVSGGDWARALIAGAGVDARAVLAVGGLVGDDLRPGRQAMQWAFDASAGDPRIFGAERARNIGTRLFPRFPNPMDEVVTSWLPRPWQEAPRAALLLWEAASLAIAELPGGMEEAARLDSQRLWLAARLGDEDDRASARRSETGPGLVARRMRAERAEAALARAGDPAEVLLGVERLVAGPLAAVPSVHLDPEDALVVQVIVGRELLTVRTDATGSRLTRRPLDVHEFLARLERWRGTLHSGSPGAEDAGTLAEALGAEAVFKAPGVLHFVGVGPLSKLPLNALPMGGGELGRQQAWVRYDRPSRVGSTSGEPLLATLGTALWESGGTPPLPKAAFESSQLSLLRPQRATRAALLQALGEPKPLHIASHARGGRLDNSGAGIHCVAFNAQGEEINDEVDLDALGGIQVRPPIIYLSACSSALGSLVAGDTPLGFAGALLARGARCVVATQWPLADDVAPGVAREFWAQVRQVHGPALALRKALAADTHAAPLWAALEVHGGPRPPVS